METPKKSANLQARRQSFAISNSPEERSEERPQSSEDVSSGNLPESTESSMGLSEKSMSTPSKPTKSSMRAVGSALDSTIASLSVSSITSMDSSDKNKPLIQVLKPRPTKRSVQSPTDKSPSINPVINEAPRSAFRRKATTDTSSANRRGMIASPINTSITDEDLSLSTLASPLAHVTIASVTASPFESPALSPQGSHALGFHSSPSGSLVPTPIDSSPSHSLSSSPSVSTSIGKSSSHPGTYSRLTPFSFSPQSTPPHSSVNDARETSSGSSMIPTTSEVSSTKSEPVIGSSEERSRAVAPQQSSASRAGNSQKLSRARSSPTASLPATSSLQYSIPVRSRWFRMDYIHKVERNALPEFFPSQITKSTTDRQLKTSDDEQDDDTSTYKACRDWIILAWRRDPRTYLNFTTVRRFIQMDVTSLYRIYRFLESWELINYLVDDRTRPRLLPHSLPPHTEVIVELLPQSRSMASTDAYTSSNSGSRPVTVAAPHFLHHPTKQVSHFRSASSVYPDRPDTSNVPQSLGSVQQPVRPIPSTRVLPPVPQTFPPSVSSHSSSFLVKRPSLPPAITQSYVLSSPNLNQYVGESSTHTLVNSLSSSTIIPPSESTSSMHPGQTSFISKGSSAFSRLQPNPMALPLGQSVTPQTVPQRISNTARPIPQRLHPLGITLATDPSTPVPPSSQLPIYVPSQPAKKS